MEEESFEDGFGFRSNESEDSRVRGMESVVATVSGYHGMERFKLIKLITQTGANYVGAMTKSTTHLVCWQFEGMKYSLAKSFGTIIVSHRWFEDCVKEGKRLPERPYLMQSGQQVGPLLWNVPAGKKDSLLTGKNSKILYDRSNICKDTRQQEIDIGCSAWVDSHLLRKNLFSHLETNNKNLYKTEKSAAQKTSKRERRVSSKKCSLEPLVSGSVRVQNEEPSSSVLSGRRTRDNCSAVGSLSTAEPIRKGRRLVKKDASGDILDSVALNCASAGTCNQFNNTNSASNDSNDLTNENTLTTEAVTAEDGFHDYGENRTEGLEDVEEVLELNNRHVSNDLNRLNEETLTAQERTLQNGFSDFEENMDGPFKDIDEFGEITELPTSIELSCVICWTDFSSTRGVLPCGHRFCYSCIQSWADHMASRRKVSTCPLCKASFVSITKVDCAVSSDQKIYSQTIPVASGTTDIFILPDREFSSSGGQLTGLVCCECRCREPEDLLISCHLCRSRWVHSYCLDPPLDPWTCIHCRDLRMLYHRMR